MSEHRKQTRRWRSTSLFEVLLCVSLIGGLFLTLGTFVRVALRWSETTGEVLRTTHRTELLRSRLATESRGCQPVAGLFVSPDSKLSEGESEDAHLSWRSGEALVLRSADHYTVFAHEGDRLLVRRLESSGRASVTPLLTGLANATFDVDRDAMGTPRGIGFRVRFKRGADATGFVALRTTPSARPPIPTPARAPRFGAKGQ